MRAAFLAGVMAVGGAVSGAQRPQLASPVCVDAGKWKGSQKSEILSSPDGSTRIYGQVQWDRPGKWTHQRCEAFWWVYASAHGGKFKAVLGRTDFVKVGQTASLAVAGFAPDGRKAAADVMTAEDVKVVHGYAVVELGGDHASCFGSAAKGLDAVAAELDLGQAPGLGRLMGVRDDGWLELSVRRGSSATDVALESKGGPKLVFNPCSSKLRVERGR